MATDVDVQYFSHLNGLTLGNNWGDLIRLLDTCLVGGLPLTSITSASIDAQGDITLNLYAAHNCMLFQIIELTGFAPSDLNGKYRIKGTPTSTQLILKATHIGKTVTTAGTAKLASLGYDIIFRDTSDVKRVYRAKNPTAQHPFIRVDESLTSPDGTTGVYASTYAKYAMVGLLEHMEHIDDYENPDVLQLPFDPAYPATNWKIAGTGATVKRGWSRWTWAKSGSGYTNSTDSTAPVAANRNFTLLGDKDAFYLLNQVGTTISLKYLQGCGLFDSALDSSVIPNWFLFSHYSQDAADVSYGLGAKAGSSPLQNNIIGSCSYVNKYTPATRLNTIVESRPILPDYQSGRSAIYANTLVPALQVPFHDIDLNLRGTYKHVCYAGKAIEGDSKPILAESSMYISDTAFSLSGNIGGFYFYLGELE